MLVSKSRQTFTFAKNYLQNIVKLFIFKYTKKAPFVISYNHINERSLSRQITILVSTFSCFLFCVSYLFTKKNFSSFCQFLHLTDFLENISECKKNDFVSVPIYFHVSFFVFVQFPRFHRNYIICLKLKWLSIFHY